MTTLLKIVKLKVRVAGKYIIRGLSLSVGRGEIYAIMGANGSGKSSLANAVMGNPSYKITGGEIIFEGKKINKLDVVRRARLGIFMSFQEPPETGGVEMRTFLKTIAKKRHGLPDVADELKDEEGRRTQIRESALAMKQVDKILPDLGLGEEFLLRNLNHGFSGGEKKKSEVLQLLALSPKLAILDEIDSGLDAKSLKQVVGILKSMVRSGMGLVIISHYAALFKYIKPDRMYEMKKGKMARNGGGGLLRRSV
jgi:Fe-S cluster assembly ATP-binding protein